MRTGVITQKVGMSRLFLEDGRHVPVTVLKIEQCQVVAVRTAEKDGYSAVQLGVGKAKVKNVSKPVRGHYAKAKVEPKKKLVEFRVSADAVLEVGAEISAEHFVVPSATLSDNRLKVRVGVPTASDPRATFTAFVALVVGVPAAYALSRWTGGASGTTSARVMPKPSVMYGTAHRPAKAPISDTGTAMIGISVARAFCRKMNTTRITSSIASASVISTSRIDTSTKRVVS